jgi:hypothetical protein
MIIPSEIFQIHLYFPVTSFVLIQFLPYRWQEFLRDVNVVVCVPSPQPRRLDWLHQSRQGGGSGLRCLQEGYKKAPRDSGGRDG